MSQTQPLFSFTTYFFKDYQRLETKKGNWTLTLMKFFKSDGLNQIFKVWTPQPHIQMWDSLLHKITGLLHSQKRQNF